MRPASACGRACPGSLTLALTGTGAGPELELLVADQSWRGQLPHDVLGHDHCLLVSPR